MNTIENIVKHEEFLAYLENIQNYKLVCFGASKSFEITLERLALLDVNPDFVCDNDVSKHGTFINGYKIYNPEEIFCQNHQFVVIISSMYWNDIKHQLAIYKNIICFNPLLSKIFKTNMDENLEISLDNMSSLGIKELAKHEETAYEKFKEYNYLDYLSYCNQIIFEKYAQNILYLHDTKYNFNENNVKKLLDYYIFRSYENNTNPQIYVKSLAQLKRGKLVDMIEKTFLNLSNDKFELLRSTQTLTKRKEHVLIWHLYHMGMFDEIRAELQDAKELFDIYISINSECSIEDIQKIIYVYPYANIFMFENRGRDVLPFLKILRKIYHLNYYSMCKIHTKKSVYRDDGQEWGKVLRTSLFQGQKTILHEFQTHKDIGTYVAKGNRANFPTYDINTDNLRAVCKLVDTPYSDDFSFPLGTMFWSKMETLSQLVSPNLEDKYFSLEDGEFDGKLGHTIERLIGLLIKNRGYKLLEI